MSAVYGMIVSPIGILIYLLTSRQHISNKINKDYEHMKIITGIYDKFTCFIFGHLEGAKASCPFTLYTYTYCIRCNEIYKYIPSDYAAK